MKNLKYLALLVCVFALAGCPGPSPSPTDAGCVTAGGNCTLGGQPCCSGSVCNGTTLKCETCVPKDGDCSALGALCCEGLKCDESSKKCTDCKALGKDCEENSECCQPSDTTIGHFCDLNLDVPVCSICQQKGGTCATDFDCCEADVTPDKKELICASDKKCALMCKKNTDCQTTEHPTWICMNGECVAPACTSDADCGAKKCCSGACKDDCGYGPADHCKLTTAGSSLFKGQSMVLTAIAYKGDDVKGTAVPGTAITWTATGSVSVANGTVTANSVGAGTVRATAGTIDCGDAAFNVIDDVTGVLQVLVVDESTGLPVSGATVNVGGTVKTTGADGVATGFAAGGDVHVFKTGYVYVSVTGATGINYLIYINPLPPSDDVKGKKGGFHGAANFSKFGADAQKITLALAGNTITGNLLDLDFNTLIGEMLLTHIELRKSEGAPLEVDEWMRLPGAVMGGAPMFNKPVLISEYRILGVPGLRAAWGLGVGLTNSDVTKLVSGVTQCIGDEIDIGCILAGALPVITKFKSAIQSAFVVTPIDMIETPCQLTTGKAAEEDSDPYCIAKGKGPKGWLSLVEAPFMADYTNMPKLDMVLQQSLGVQSKFTVSDMPTLMGTCMSGVAMLGGTYIPGVGMLPLGLTAGVGAKDQTTAPCKIVWSKTSELKTNELQINQAPNHSGTEGNQYMAVFMSLNFNDIGSEGSSNAMSGIVLLGPKAVQGGDISATNPFLGYDEGSSYTPTTKTIVSTAVAGASFYRVQIENDNGKWLVYSAAPGTVTLPDAPVDMFTDSEAAIHAIKSSVSLSDLVTKTSGAAHLNSLFEVVSAFSTVGCQVKLPPTDPDCQTTPKASACNPACEQK